jgi:hypothetical protein
MYIVAYINSVPRGLLPSFHREVLGILISKKYLCNFWRSAIIFSATEHPNMMGSPATLSHQSIFAR